MPITNSSSVTGFVDLLQYYNTVAKGTLGWMFLTLIFLVFFFTMKEYDTARAFAAAMAITAIISIAFYLMELVSGTAVVICWVALGVAGLGIVMQNSAN